MWKTTQLRLISVCTWLCSNVFFYFRQAILSNSDVTSSSWGSWLDIWTHDFWGTPLTHTGSHKSYRPLTTLTFKLNWIITGPFSTGFHIVNIFLHCLATGLFYQLSRSLLKDQLAILFSTCMFSSHPIHTEAVTGIVGRADVSATIFCLLSFMYYRKHIRFRERKLHLYLSMFFACLSTLCKEYGVSILLVCVMYDIYLQTKFHPKELHRIFIEVSWNSTYHKSHEFKF